MRYISLLLLLACTCLAGCNKKGTEMPEMQFGIGNVQDLIMDYNGELSASYDIYYLDGGKESVTISCSGLPKGVSATFDQASGTPTFSPSVTFKATAAAIGTFTIQLNAVTAGGVTKTAAFDLTITMDVVNADCSTDKDADYKVTETYDGIIKPVYTAHVTRLTKNRLLTEDDIILDLICPETSVVAFPQTYKAYKIQGGGAIMSTGFTINCTYTESAGGATHTLNRVYKKI